MAIARTMGMHRGLYAHARTWKRRSKLYTSGVFPFTHDRTTLLVDQAPHQFGKRQKICDPDNRAAFADDDLRIGRHVIRPLRRYRAHGLLVDPQQEPRTIPVVPLADADKLLSGERVEWMRHAYKMRGRGRRACILS